MKSLSVLGSRRFKACALWLLAVAWLAVGCGNNGGSGDGVYDDSIPPGGASSAGKSGAKAGAQNSGAGASSLGGAPSAGSGGTGGASGASGGAAGNAPLGGSAGTLAIGGSGGGNTGPGGGAGTAAGGSSAGATSLTCGNGKLEAGEACDDGTKNTGGAGTGGAGTGGDRATAGAGGDDMGRAGAPPVVAQYNGQTCSNTCVSVGTLACFQCEQGGDCSESVDNCLGPSDSPFNAAQQSACFAVMRCIQASNCLDGTNTTGKCYCGSLSTAACGAAPFSGAGSPDGACVNEFKAGFPSFLTNTQILGNFTATEFPSGAAIKRLSCQKGASSGQCLAVCGFTAGGPAFP